MTMAPARNPALLPLALLVTLAAAVAQDQPEYHPLCEPKTDWDSAQARYQECLQRLPFLFHTQGRERLGGMRSTEALAVLAKDYAKPAQYPEFTKYSLGSMFARYFDGRAYVEPLATLRSANGEEVDTWLWVQSLRIEANHGQEAAVLDIATSDPVVHHRAAALVALGKARNANIKTAIVANCVAFPKKDGERNLILAAMTGALFDNKIRVNDAEYRDALKAYIGLLAPDVKLSQLGKVQMARHLQWILKTPAMFENEAAWLEYLERGDVKTKTDNRTSAGTRFFGIETEGEKFCYVLDMSDSMSREIAPSSRPQAAVTGPRQKKPKGALPDESDLPWNKITTRWDLAREQLRISLQRLPPDKYFSVVWFGTDAGTIEATKGMVKSTKGNISKVMAELDSIKVLQGDANKGEEGVLRGSTNIHAGLRVAYSLTNRGFVQEAAFVDARVLEQGCDTIFLLSDGAPSNDSFRIEDKDYGEGKVVKNIETGVQATRTPRIHYHGPYDQRPWLEEEVVRMNTFRRIRLHCIGLGEADMGLLGKLAELGNGEVYQFGQKK